MGAGELSGQPSLYAGHGSAQPPVDQQRGPLGGVARHAGRKQVADRVLAAARKGDDMILRHRRAGSAVCASAAEPVDQPPPVPLGDTWGGRVQKASAIPPIVFAPLTWMFTHRLSVDTAECYQHSPGSFTSIIAGQSQFRRLFSLLEVPILLEEFDSRFAVTTASGNERRRHHPARLRKTRSR